MTSHELQLKAIALRRSMLRLIFNAGAGHTGGGLSCLDILNVLYNRVMNVSPQNFNHPTRDRYVQSKGHCVEALYTVLADRGFFPASDLETVCHYQSDYVGHPTRHIPGIEMNTGALGHGLPICVGMALAAKMASGTGVSPLSSKIEENRIAEPGNAGGFRVFTLLGDGEIAEGSNWEAAMAAAHYRLDNLVAILDHNTLQITGHTRDVCCNEPIDEKFRAFGWSVRSVDGHDYSALIMALTAPAETGKPTMIIANTIKGKGVSFMENVAKWHHGVPNETELKAALAELEEAEKVLRKETN